MFLKISNFSQESTCVWVSFFFFESRVFIVRANQVRASWEAKGGETNQVRSTKIYFDIFIETMFAFLHHLLIENFKPESYCFERNSRIWRLNDYHFKLYKQHDGTFRGLQITLKNWNCRLLREEKLTVVKFFQGHIRTSFSNFRVPLR